MEKESSLTITERRLIQSLFRKKRAIDIASLIDKPVELVNREIVEFAKNGNGRLSFDQMKRQTVGRKPDRRCKRKTSKSLKRPNKELGDSQHRKPSHYVKKAREKVFESKCLDLTSKIRIIIDRKTTIYVDPGVDIDRIKELYQQKTSGYWKH